MKLKDYINNPDFAKEWDKLHNPKNKEYLRMKTEEFIIDLCVKSGRTEKQVINMVVNYLERIKKNN